MLLKLCSIVSTFFYTGHLPRFNALTASAITLILCLIFDFEKQNPALIVILVIVFIICGWYYLKKSQKHDPPEMVSDECLAAASIVFFFESIPYAVLCLIFFRIFDILKVFPISILDKKEVWIFVFLDDLLAVAYAVIVTYLIEMVWNQLF